MHYGFHLGTHTCIHNEHCVSLVEAEHIVAQKCKLDALGHCNRAQAAYSHAEVNDNDLNRCFGAVWQLFSCMSMQSNHMSNRWSHRSCMYNVSCGGLHGSGDHWYRQKSVRSARHSRLSNCFRCMTLCWILDSRSFELRPYRTCRGICGRGSTWPNHQSKSMQECWLFLLKRYGDQSERCPCRSVSCSSGRSRKCGRCEGSSSHTRHRLSSHSRSLQNANGRRARLHSADCILDTICHHIITCTALLKDNKNRLWLG